MSCGEEENSGCAILNLKMNIDYYYDCSFKKEKKRDEKSNEHWR